MPLPRIGVLIPSTNTTVEADFQRVLAGKATLHAERLFIPDGEMTAAFLDEMNRDLALRVKSLASARVDVIAYACTSGSFYKGPGWDDEVVAQVKAISGVPCITTSQAVKSALEKVSPSRSLAVVTPYPEWTNLKLREYYEAAGFTIQSIAGDARAAQGGHRSINDQPPAQVLDFAVRHFSKDAEAIFCSCTAWRAFEMSAELEAQTGRPVITSNQATIWQTFEILDLSSVLDASVRARFGQLGARSAANA